jgi:hypothetical protein
MFIGVKLKENSRLQQRKGRKVLIYYIVNLQRCKCTTYTYIPSSVNVQKYSSTASE